MTFVRPFQLSDYASLTNLLANVLSEVCYEETITAFARQLSLDSDLVLVAVDNQQTVGVIIGTIHNNEGYYYRIAVDRAHQRKGIGKLLIQGLKQRFEQRSVSRVLISVDMHNEPLLPLYESLGYKSRDFMRSVEQLRIVNG